VWTVRDGGGKGAGLDAGVMCRLIGSAGSRSRNRPW